MKMTIRQRKNLADKISKHLVTIKESDSNKFVYLNGKSLIDIVDGRYSLWTTCLGTFKQPVFCDLYIDDIDLLLKYQNKLNELDIYVDKDFIKVRNIGEMTFNKI